MAADKETVVSIAGRQTTAGAAEETVLLSLNGAAPVAAIPVAIAQSLVITDWGVCAAAPARWRLQQTNDGVTFFDIGLAEVPGVLGTPTVLYSPKTGWIPKGGANVAVRVRVETTGGIALVTTTLRAYFQS